MEAMTRNKEHKKPIKRRTFLKLGGTGLAGGLLMPRLVHSKTQELIKLNFLFGPDDSGTIRATINNFNKQNAGSIEVNWIEMSRLSDDYYRQFKSEFTVESASIDVLGADVPWTAAFARNGWVRDITRKFFNEYETKDILESALNSVSYRYKVWGVPWYTDVGMIYYRKDLLAASGYNKPPDTWAELRTMAKKVMQDSKLPFGFVFQGAEYEGAVANALEYIWNSGGRVLTGNISVAGSFGQNIIDPNVITVNSIDAATGFDEAYRMISEGVSPREVANFEELQCSQAFLDGQAIFMRNWPYVYGLLSDTKQSSIRPDQVGVAAIPSTSSSFKQYGCQGGWNLMINRFNDSDKEDAAWTFIKWMTAPKQQRFMAINAGFLPTYQSLYDDQEILRKVPVIALGKDRIKNIRTRPISPFYDQISPRISRTFNRVLKGEITGSEAVAGLEKELRTILRKNR